MTSEFLLKKSGISVLTGSWAGINFLLPHFRLLNTTEMYDCTNTEREVTTATTLWIWKGNSDYPEVPRGFLNLTQSCPVFLIVRDKVQREVRAPCCTKNPPESLDALSLPLPTWL